MASGGAYVEQRRDGKDMRSFFLASLPLEFCCHQTFSHFYQRDSWCLSNFYIRAFHTRVRCNLLAKSKKFFAAMRNREGDEDNWGAIVIRAVMCKSVVAFFFLLLFLRSTIANKTKKITKVLNNYSCETISLKQCRKWWHFFLPTHTIFRSKLKTKRTKVELQKSDFDVNSSVIVLRRWWNVFFDVSLAIMLKAWKEKTF